MQESVVSNYVGHRDRTQALELDCKHLYLLNHIAGPTLLLKTNIKELLAMPV